MPTTHRALLAGVVRAATGRHTTDWTPMTSGEKNEVYAATLESGGDVIVRVCRRDARFESERWAVAAAREAGVPAPEMLHLEHLEDEAGQLWVCVEKRLPGHHLDEVRDVEDRRRLVEAAGEVTAKLHTVALQGFGRLRPDGTCDTPSWAAVVRAEQSDPELAVTAERAAALGIPPAWIYAAAAELRGHDELFDAVESRLLHGDLSPGTFFTDDKTITGWIDFEDAIGGDVAYEFVWWNYFQDETPLEWALTGYRRVADLGPDLELRIRLGRLRVHIGLADYYGKVGDVTKGRVLARRFAEDANWFGFDA